MRHDLSTEQLADIVMRLNGDIEPVGETNTDNTRLINLATLEGVIDCLLMEIYFVSKNADHYEYSRKRAGEDAIAWLKDRKEWIEEVLSELNEVDE